MQDGFIGRLNGLQHDNMDVHIIHDNALHFENYIGTQHIDYIISGLPLTFMRLRDKKNLLARCSRILGTHGVFIQFQYSFHDRQLIESYFTSVDITTIVRNIPPAFVYVCKNKYLVRRIL